MSIEMIGRILSRTKELGLTPRGAALKAGMGPTAIHDIVKRPGASPRVETVRKLAEALETTPEWLTYGIHEGDEAGPLNESEMPTSPSVVAMSSEFIQAEYGGTLQAGSFREVDDVIDPDRGPEIMPRDPRWPHAAYVVFDVVGDSMNAATPPVPEGSRVLAVRTDNYARPIRLQTGDLVVVQRTQAQGGMIERSVKELEMGESETRYHPRSTNKRHQAIVVPNDPNTEDETTVEVLGLVTDVLTKVRR